ncbi:hypothetical protein ACROYT_G039870 [Oculina patagonica]
MEVEEQAVSEVESCLTYKKMALCSMNKDQLRAKLTLPNPKRICHSANNKNGVAFNEDKDVVTKYASF